MVYILFPPLRVWVHRIGTSMREEAIFGLTRGSSNAHIARAALDSIAYQTYDVLKAMEADSGIQYKRIKSGWWRYG